MNLANRLANWRLLSVISERSQQSGASAVMNPEKGRLLVHLYRLALALCAATLLAACGSVVAANPGPLVTLTPAATSVEPGSSMSLTLQTTSATSCVGTSGISGPQPLNGTITVSNIMETTTFAVTCQGPTGTTTAQTEVVVVQDAPTVTLTATSTTIASGAQTTLSWNATNAQTCVSSGGWSGSLATSGSQVTGPLTATTDFSLLCTGPGGSATQSVTITVDASATVAQLVAVPSTVAAGSVVSLNYSESNAASCTLSGGGWSYNPALPSGSVNSPPIGATTNFTLTCTGVGGDASQSATVSVIQSVPTVSISATSSTIPYNTATSINWTSTNATGCTASGAWSGGEPLNGSMSTGVLTHNQTYTLTCTGPGGSTSQATTVTVSAAAPAVSISASPGAIIVGSASTLSWSSSNTTSCTASGGWNGAKSVSGSQSTGTLNASTTFTLTCSGASSSASQSATVSVTQPLPTVTLTANPSTVANGASAVLTWTTANATSCVASGGWSGGEPINGSTSTGNLTSDQSYTLTCTGLGGSASQTATVTASAAAPTISLHASPSTITAGSSSTLTWSATNATSCAASGGWSGNLAVSGSQSTGELDASATFTITCTGAGGNASQSARVSVTQALPTVNLSASPSTVASGSSATLTWTSTNVTSCTASGGWSGGKPINGSTSTGNLTSNQSYTLTCTGPGGSAAQSATVTVSTPAPTVTLSAGPSAVTSGSSSTLTWSAADATSCTASGSWSGGRPISGSQSTGALTADASYTLTCTGPGGSASQSATVSVSAPAPTITISANPSTIASGNTSTLTWASTNATSCSASDGWSGNKGLSGSVSTAALTATTVYTLSCTGTGGSASQSATVTVNAPTPVVTISANPTTVNAGSTAVLTWSSTNANTCNASNGWTGAQPTSGRQATVPLSATTKFVLTCTGDGGTAHNSATVSVTVTPPTVSLSASPSSVDAGDSSTLTWSSTNADTCAASGAFTGPLPPSGSQIVNNIAKNSTYTLTCTNAAGSNSISATITVAPTITGNPATTATVGTPYSFTPTATGGLGVLLTFSIQHMPSWASFNSTTGALTGTPSAAGTFSNIIVSVSDGILTVPLPAFSITVGTGGGGGPGATCSATSGALNLSAKVTRSSGISPLLVFLDATGTTDSALTGNTTAFQDVTYTWNFGDTGASGTGIWANGSNAGNNSKNSATGGIAAHLYITNGSDKKYTATVTATDGTDTASCQLAVTAYDPSGSNGFPNSATTCVSSAGTPVPGSGGCPVGANASKQTNFASALGSSQSGKRILFKCGETFTGNNASLAGTNFSIGAYGGCEGTQSNRPIISDSGSTGEFTIPPNATVTDGRVSDLDFEGNGTGNYAISTSSGGNNGTMALYNLYSNGNAQSYKWSQGTQWGLIDSVMTGESQIGVFVNYAENNCVNQSASANCGGTPVFENVDYQALLGNSFDGKGAPNSSAGVEVARISACRMCVVENNKFENANNVGAVLKFHSGNTYNSLSTWIGQYTELVEISDNLFTGASGAQLVETSPQNSGDDERMRNIVVERNLFSAGLGAQGGRLILVSAVNESVRDNVFYIPSTTKSAPFRGVQVAQRGAEPVPQAVELYNNTCYFLVAQSGQACVSFDGVNFGAPGTHSYAENNLLYTATNGYPTVVNNGAGNTVSSNTPTSTNNPALTNDSGDFSLISDFKPSAQYSGGASVPVVYDALGVPWSSTWDLGAVHH
jgi:hypothetical protein